jgi:hypothetical protein
MQQSEAWLLQQGWKQGEGLGRGGGGIARPIALKRVMSFEQHDFNHYSHVYEKALRKLGGGDPEKEKELVFEGMFVKAAAGPVTSESKASVRVEDERELLERCGNRTARRSIKKLKLTAEEESALEKAEAKKRGKEEKKAKKARKEKKKKKSKKDKKSM